MEAQVSAEIQSLTLSSDPEVCLPNLHYLCCRCSFVVSHSLLAALSPSRSLLPLSQSSPHAILLFLRPPIRSMTRRDFYFERDCKRWILRARKVGWHLKF